MKRKAVIVDLSASTRVVIATKPSGAVHSATILRGREAFTLADNEARKLGEALAEHAPDSEPPLRLVEETAAA
jgi:hypothetical protein